MLEPSLRVNTVVQPAGGDEISGRFDELTLTKATMTLPVASGDGTVSVSELEADELSEGTNEDTKATCAWAGTAAQAQVAFVSSLVPSLSSSASSSLTLTVPSPLATGNVMVAFVSVNSSNLPDISSPPAGWTTVLTRNDGSSIDVGVYYRVATSADAAGTTNYTWNLSSSARVAGGISAFSGVSTLSPGVASGSGGNRSGSSHTSPSVIPGVTNIMLGSLSGICNGNEPLLFRHTGSCKGLDLYV